MSNANQFYDNVDYNLSDSIFNCLLGKITEFDSSTRKASVQPLSKRLDLATGEYQELPLLIDIPVLHAKAGGFIINYPVGIDDIVIVFFSDYDISNLLLDGRISDNNTIRVHDIQDSIALPLSLNLFTNNIIEHTSDLVIAKDDYSSKITISTNGQIDIQTATDRHLSITTQGEGNVNIDAWNFNVTQRDPNA